MNKWSEFLNIPYPECKQTGQCCRCATPSYSPSELLKRASEGDQLARDFFSLFVPYNSIEEAREVNPGIVDKALNIALKSLSHDVTTQNLTFYKCRYILENNKCSIHENRPELCRSYPDSPFLLIPPGCAYEEWSVLCKEKYKNMKEELSMLKEIEKELECEKYHFRVQRILSQISTINNEDYNLSILLSSINIVSPAHSWIKIF